MKVNVEAIIPVDSYDLRRLDHDDGIYDLINVTPKVCVTLKGFGTIQLRKFSFASVSTVYSMQGSEADNILFLSEGIDLKL